MQVIVKNNQISKTHISKMSYNPIHNILACNIDGNDTILFYSLHPQTLTFIQIFKGMSKPPGSKISLSWSPNGNHLALGAANIQLWQLKDSKLKPVKSFQQDFIEIKIIQWSIDSLSYACGGISRTNTIRIRNIETGKIKQLQLTGGQTISGISFDPYGKYLMMLLRDNTVEIYSVLNYQKYKTVRLSPEGIKVNPIKEVRTASWSPDFSNFLCPSLDDSRINVAINLSRSRDFKTKNIFMGHCTSISCCKFNPKLYRWNGQVTAIAAMGDSAGNVSFWRIGNKIDYPEPLLLSNSLENSMQVVEDIEWDDKGQILMVNMMKKYIHLIKFTNKEKYFGKELTNDETFSLIKQIYGSSRATDVNKRQIQVFNLGFSGWVDGTHEEQKKVDANKGQVIGVTTLETQKAELPANPIKEKTEMQAQEVPKPLTIVQTQKMIPQPLEQSFPNPISQNVSIPMGFSPSEYVKVSDQKIIMGKNNKKKIQPAMMVRKDEIPSITLRQPLPGSYNIGLPPNTTMFCNSMVQTFQSLELPLITFTDKQLTLSKHKILEIKRLNKVTSIEIIDLLDESNEPTTTRRIFPLCVDYIHVTDKLLYVINQQFLYVFDFQLNPKQLPFKVGHIHKLLANDTGDVYFITCSGYLIGFNHIQNISKTTTPVPLHFLLRDGDFNIQPKQEMKMTIKEFVLTISNDVLVVVQIEKGNGKVKVERYLYDVGKSGWVRLEFKEGLLEPGFSIRITDSQENMIKNFFTTLCPTLRQHTTHPPHPKPKPLPTQCVISPEQQSMIFYSKYHQDKAKYFNSLIDYIKSLKSNNRNKELRTSINRWFFDAKSKVYIGGKEERERLWARVKGEVGGVVVEEFEMLAGCERMMQQQ